MHRRTVIGLATGVVASLAGYGSGAETIGGDMAEEDQNTVQEIQTSTLTPTETSTATPTQTPSKYRGGGSSSKYVDVPYRTSQAKR